MAVFEDAVELVLANEGGFADSPNDPGGMTNMGISLRFLREVPAERLRQYGLPDFITPEVISALTREQAIAVYRGEFWDQAAFASIMQQRTASYMLDMAVHHGIAPAVKIVQRAIWATTIMLGYGHDDGVLGVRTLNSINFFGNCQPLHDRFITALVSERSGHCRLIAALREGSAEFLHGWLERCYRI